MKTEPTDRTRRARTVVAAHLLAGERIDLAMPGACYSPPRPLSLVRHAEGFLGIALGHPRALVLTNRRLLVLSLKATDKGGDRWYDLQLARERTQATAYVERGGMRVVLLSTGFGDRVLVLKSRDDERGRQLATALGLRS